jgi:hypothetical protein
MLRSAANSRLRYRNCVGCFSNACCDPSPSPKTRTSVILSLRRFSRQKDLPSFSARANSRSFAPPPQQRQRRPLPGTPAALRMTPLENSFSAAFYGTQSTLKYEDDFYLSQTETRSQSSSRTAKSRQPRRTRFTVRADQNDVNSV